MATAGSADPEGPAARPAAAAGVAGLLLSIFAAPARRAAVVAMVIIGAILAGYVYVISLYLQKVLGFSPLQTGLGPASSGSARSRPGRTTAPRCCRA
jgi:hypothetical protein